MLPYVYQNLSPSAKTDQGTIRLLKLHPGLEQSELCGNLVEQYTTHEYEALSYCWGDSSASPDDLCICILEGSKRYKLSIKHNLDAALRRLRLKHKERTLWIDAVCINQNDNDEKSFQVPRMREIYQNSKTVCVWLGEATSVDATAIHYIMSMRGLTFLDESMDSKWAASWAALASFMKKDWFGRRWIIQEIGFARKAIVYCGRHELHWEELASAISMFCHEADSINKDASSRTDTGNRIFDTGNINFLDASMLVKTLENTFRRTNEGCSVNSMSLEALVSQFTFFKTTMPHDTIYAILSLAKGEISTATSTGTGRDSRSLIDYNATTGKHRSAQRTQESIITIDYNKSQVEVCEDFLKFVIESSGSLDIICRPWAPAAFCIPGASNRKQGVPSWICPLSKAPMQIMEDGTHVRNNADLLIGEPDSKTALYMASMDTIPILDPFGNKNHCLSAEGFVLSHIRENGEIASDAAIPKSWLALGGSFRPEVEPPPDDLWRTMIADRDEGGQIPSTVYRTVCQYVLSLGSKAPGSFIELDKIVSGNSTNLIKAYVRRIMATIRNRRLVRTEEYQFGNEQHQSKAQQAQLNTTTRIDKGFLGLVPMEAELGDMICLLRGCSVPVIMRSVSEPGFKQQQWFPNFAQPLPGCPAPDLNARQQIKVKLIGACYIHGIMDGSAFEISTMLGHRDCLFEIV